MELDNRHKRFLADTAAAVSFSVVVGGAIEVGIVGMTLEQMVQSRATIGALNTAIGGVYGKFRDGFFNTLGIDEGSRSHTKYLGDTCAQIVFWVPLYATNLYMCGVNNYDNAMACATIGASQFVTGRPYGLWLEYVRSVSGVTSKTKQNGGTGE